MNKSKEQPRLKDFSGASISRTRHLTQDESKRIPTYPGPGQRPDSDYIENYSPPEDWPKKGNILRVPQVVWLSCHLPDRPETIEVGTTHAEHRIPAYVGGGNFTYQYFTGEFVPIHGFINFQLYSQYGVKIGHVAWGNHTDGGYGYTHYRPENNTYTREQGEDTGVTYHLAEWGEPERVLDSPPLKDGQQGRPWEHDTRQNVPLPKISNELESDIFPEVQKRIKELRPGRTWAEPIDWGGDLWDGSAYSDAYIPMLASHMENYFGTNFLHIHAGSIVSSRNGEKWEGDASDYIYMTERENVKNAYKNYAGFRVMLWGLPVPPAEFPPFTPIPPYEQDTSKPVFPDVQVMRGPYYKVVGKYPNEKIISDPEPYNHPYDFEDFYQENSESERLVAELQNSINGLNKYNEKSYEDLKKDINEPEYYAKEMANDLADFGFTYEGDGDELSADDIIAKIAKHFRFDPKTGKDLEE